MQLTKAEEQIMQILWDSGGGLVREIREKDLSVKELEELLEDIKREIENNKKRK